VLTEMPSDKSSSTSHDAEKNLARNSSQPNCNEPHVRSMEMAEAYQKLRVPLSTRLERGLVLLPLAGIDSRLGLLEQTSRRPEGGATDDGGHDGAGWSLATV
jgi:hypothetical protein